jgi:hypothetical protein
LSGIQGKEDEKAILKIRVSNMEYGGQKYTLLLLWM